MTFSHVESASTVEIMKDVEGMDKYESGASMGKGQCLEWPKCKIYMLKIFPL